jgi:microcystin-dependent protein
MPTVFPSSPAVGEEFVVGSTAYRWNGSVWLVVKPTTPLGIQGPTGATGPTGPSVLYETGSIQMYAGVALPGSAGDWLYCDGSILNASTNPAWQALYNKIGNAYGGSNNTNFVLPNLCVGSNLGLSGYTQGAGHRRFTRGRTTINTAVEDYDDSGYLGAASSGAESSHTHTNNTDNIGMYSNTNINHYHQREGGNIGDHGHYFNTPGSGSANLPFGAANTFAGYARAGHYHYGGYGVTGRDGNTGGGNSSYNHNHNTNASLSRSATTAGTAHRHDLSYPYTELYFIIKT